MHSNNIYSRYHDITDHSLLSKNNSMYLLRDSSEILTLPSIILGIDITLLITILKLLCELKRRLNNAYHVQHSIIIILVFVNFISSYVILVLSERFI